VEKSGKAAEKRKAPLAGNGTPPHLSLSPREGEGKEQVLSPRGGQKQKALSLPERAG
jgi:hypothetical protein